MKDIVIGVVGLAALLIAGWQALTFIAHSGQGFGNMISLLVAIVAFVVAVGCVVAYFTRHPRVEEEIHVTK